MQIAKAAFLSDPAPNKPVERTAHLAGFFGLFLYHPGWAAAHQQRSAFALSGGMLCTTIRDMKTHEFIWPEDRVAHIARHGVRPEEVEDVCFGRALVQRTKSTGANPVYYVLGQTAAGRYLFCVVIQFPDGKGFPVTARPMTRKEQRRFNQWKNR